MAPGPAGKVPQWVRDYRTPNWARVAWRNTRSINRFLFKRKGLKRTRAVLYLMARPVRRTTAFVKLRNWIGHQQMHMDLHEEGAGIQFLRRSWSLPVWIGSVTKSYWNAFKLGVPVYDKADFARTTGYTSEGEARMMETPEMVRTDDSYYTMPVSQAKAILDIDVSNFYPRIVDRNFARIFMANQISNGGSWYILCRIYCAKRVLDREMNELGIRDPPHLRPNNNPTDRDPADPVYKDPVFEERMAQHQRAEELNQQGRRSTVNTKSTRRSSIDPRHGSKYGFSTTSFGSRHYSTVGGAGEEGLEGDGGDLGVDDHDHGHDDDLDGSEANAASRRLDWEGQMEEIGRGRGMVKTYATSGIEFAEGGLVEEEQQALNCSNFASTPAFGYYSFGGGEEHEGNENTSW